MGKRLALWVAGCCLAAGWPLQAAAGEEPAAAAGGATRPNLLFLLTDDQRWDTLGAMGNRWIRTPHLDALAARGTLFTNAFCTTSICAISRASILTGQYERRHGIADFATMLSDKQWGESFPALLKRHGYRLGFIGKWGVGNKDLPAAKYDYWRGFPGQGRYFTPGDDEHLTDKQTRQALEFLDGCSPGEPFCLQVSFKAAHCQDGEPWQTQFPPARRHAPLYADVTFPLPPTANEAHFLRLPECLQRSEARNRWRVRFADADMYQYTVRNYYRLITGVDEAVGAMLRKLHERGLAEQTIIVFTSDNGFYLGEHGLAGKWFMHEESIRLPLLVVDPRLPEAHHGQRRDEMVLNIDVMPTLLDYAGVPVPRGVQGVSLRPLVQGDKPSWRDAFLYEHRFRHRAIPASEGVRTTRWKYCRYYDGEQVIEQLFDLATDPHEQRDLAGDPQHAATLEQLRLRWQELAQAAQ